MNITATTGNKVVCILLEKPSYGLIEIPDVVERFASDRNNWKWEVIAAGPKCKHVKKGDVVLLESWNNISIDSKTVICTEAEITALV